MKLRTFTWAVIALLVASNWELAKEMCVACAEHILYIIIGASSIVLVQTVRELHERGIL